LGAEFGAQIKDQQGFLWASSKIRPNHLWLQIVQVASSRGLLPQPRLNFHNHTTKLGPSKNSCDSSNTTPTEGTSVPKVRVCVLVTLTGQAECSPHSRAYQHQTSDTEAPRPIAVLGGPVSEWPRSLRVTPAPKTTTSREGGEQSSFREVGQ